MRTRYGLAAAFAAAIGLVLFLRNEGYLHGRVEGGPLTLTVRDAAVAAAPLETVGVGIDVGLDGDGVEVERIRPGFASPGLQVFGPRRTQEPCAQPCTIARWPPAGSTPLRGSVVDEVASAALLGLRATRPGVYHLHDLTTFYRRGIKAFRRHTAIGYCVVVGRRPPQTGACTPGYRPPRGDADVVEAGGPSRYGVPVTGGEARYVARPGRRTLAITLTNLTDGRRRISGLQADVDGVIGVRQARPARLTLPPHAARRVRLEVTVSDCVRDPATVDVLRGTVGDAREDVPLSVPLAFTPPACE